MVEVAALHMWNQKYGPQVSLDWNTPETSNTQHMYKPALET